MFLPGIAAFPVKPKVVWKLFGERLKPPLARMETGRNALEITGRITLCNNQPGPEHRSAM